MTATESATRSENTARPRRRREVTVELLLDAALEVFGEVGFGAASIEDICGRGGFTRGAFYSSFSSKDELFAALVARECARDFERAEQLLSGVAQEADPVGAAVERCVELFRSDRTWTLVSTEYTLHAARNPAAAELLRRTRAEVHTQLAGFIARTTTAAGIELAVPAEDLARAVSALHEGSCLHQLGEPDAAATDDRVRRSMLVLLRGATLSDPAPSPTPES